MSTHGAQDWRDMELWRPVVAARSSSDAQHTTLRIWIGQRMLTKWAGKRCGGDELRGEVRCVMDDRNASQRLGFYKSRVMSPANELIISIYSTNRQTVNCKCAVRKPRNAVDAAWTILQFGSSGRPSLRPRLCAFNQVTLFCQQGG